MKLPDIVSEIWISETMNSRTAEIMDNWITETVDGGILKSNIIYLVILDVRDALQMEKNCLAWFLSWERAKLSRTIYCTLLSKRFYFFSEFVTNIMIKTKYILLLLW